MVTQNKSLSRWVPLQRVATRSKNVYWQVPLQEHVVRLLPVVCQALAVQAAPRLLSC